MEISKIQLLLLCIVLFMVGRVSVTKTRTTINKGQKVLFYVRYSCPYCKKMKNEIDKKGVAHKFQEIDVETPKGEQLYEKTGADGVPYFECNGKSATGFQPVEKLFETLGIEKK